MNIHQCRIYRLRIPFVEQFQHSTSKRAESDAIVISLTDEAGCIGYGEGLARPYVTGENDESAVSYLQKSFWPAVHNLEFPHISDHRNAIDIFDSIDELLPYDQGDGAIAWNASRSTFELALIDLLLKRENLSISALIPPKASSVTYDGVISSGNPDVAGVMAKRFSKFGIGKLKVKTGDEHDEERIAIVRKVAGPDARIRVDFNGACDPQTALTKMNRLIKYDVECAEQPIPRGDVDAMAQLREQSPMPIMADESLVTVGDAQELIAGKSCDFFNLRISKLGGIGKTLKIASLAQENGIGLQIGCQVGETAILSAVGRSLAGYLSDVEYLEGSYGKMLLSEDIALEDLTFEAEGRAPMLTGPGWGISVNQGQLDKYAIETVTLT